MSLLRYSWFIYRCAYVLNIYVCICFKDGINFVKGGVGFKIKNRGTIVVLQRYVKALCFLDVFEMVVR